MNDLNGKVLLVIGATSGIGQATAAMAAGLGARIVCAGRRVEQGQAIAEEIRSSGGTADFIATDIANPASIAALFEDISGKHGRLDAAFNNAAVEVPLYSFPDIPLDVFEMALSVNVRGTFLCLQHELRIMRAQAHGSIVNTASLGGVLGIGGMGAYVASKHAVVGMTRTAAIDAAAFGVRVNAICPGAIRTDMMRRSIEGIENGEDIFANKAPMRRVGEPGEIADAAIWLLSAASSYVTGLVMEVDGGASTGIMM